MSNKSPSAALRVLFALPLILLTACTEMPAHGLSQAPSPAALPAGKIGKPYEIAGRWYVPKDDQAYRETGVASWYGPGFHGRSTAGGEAYDMYDLTAAHRTLPLPSYVTVENLDNGRQLLVRINDRGPFAEGRIIDLSRRSAQLLGVEKTGTARVRVTRAYPSADEIARLAQLKLAAAAPASALFVQVASMTVEANATALAARLADIGPVSIDRVSGFHRVRLGPFDKMADARRALDEARRLGIADARLDGNFS